MLKLVPGFRSDSGAEKENRRAGGGVAQWSQADAIHAGQLGQALPLERCQIRLRAAVPGRPRIGILQPFVCVQGDSLSSVSTVVLRMLSDDLGTDDDLDESAGRFLRPGLAVLQCIFKDGDELRQDLDEFKKRCVLSDFACLRALCVFLKLPYVVWPGHCPSLAGCPSLLICAK